MVGYYLYETLLLRPRWTACPVQIRAHHHIDVYTDINQPLGCQVCRKGCQYKRNSTSIGKFDVCLSVCNLFTGLTLPQGSTSACVYIRITMVTTHVHIPSCGNVSPVKTVTFCTCWGSRPIQIGAHHHKDVYTDINDVTLLCIESYIFSPF